MNVIILKSWLRVRRPIVKKVMFLMMVLIHNLAWSDAHDHRLQVDVKRDGRSYVFNASFDTPLTKCAAYRYLTDYEAAKTLPGVVESLAYRQSPTKVMVERTADERILLFYVRLHSVMEYTENPFNSISFTQVTGDSKTFQGQWDIEPTQRGTTLRFHGLWEPDTLIPLFIIDHFARNGLIDRFNAIAQLAEERKDTQPLGCVS